MDHDDGVLQPARTTRPSDQCRANDRPYSKCGDWQWATKIARATDAELEQMQAYVHEAMEAGAIGVSTALIYPPAVYADTDEIAALVKVAGKYGGPLLHPYAQ